MTPELEQLVRDTMAVTGAAAPSLLDDRGPTLADDALADAAAGTDFYLVGLIGGKEVGKSALVNALVGMPITQSTSFGPGTAGVVAYAHASRAAAVSALLEREVPGQFRLVTHDVPTLARQVMLDLPDIDSHWASHVEVTRRMLRHMLFPLWVQSVEKYADRQPQQLLATVAAGNSAANFLFCLNKADQLAGMSGGDPNAIDELRADFADRVGRTLSIAPPPPVFMLSAAQPGAYDLPRLRLLLSQQKSEQQVRQSRQLAVRQQDRSVAGWLAEQDLPGRAQRLVRLQQEAEELLAARVGTPLIERSLPALLDDPASRMALTDEVLAGRVAHWPLVNLVQAALTPVLAVVRRNLGATRMAALPDAEALVDAHLRPGGATVSTLVQGTFAQLQQMHPTVSELYAKRRLWEDMPADAAADALRVALTETVDRQRQVVRQQLTGRGVALAPVRWLLTIGAVLWFPFAQPVAETVMVGDAVDWSLLRRTHELVVLVVRVFSVHALLESLTFLAMYFFVLWVALRWDTQRRVAKLAGRWRAEGSDLSLTVQTVRWLDELLKPVRTARERVEGLAARAAAVGRPARPSQPREVREDL